MKKLQRILLIILSVILILILLVVIAITFFGDRALKTGIEIAGSEALGVAVTVADVDLSIFRGKLGLQNLSIDNPPDYQLDKLLEMTDARIDVGIKSLLSDVVNIEEIKLDGINVTLEQKGITRNNIQDILKTISGKEEKDEQQAEPSGKKLHIDNLEISNVTVNAKLLPASGKANTMTLTLAPIQMTDLGGDNKMDIAELSGKILMVIAKGIAEKGASRLPDNIIGPLNDELKQLGEISKTLLKERDKILDVEKDLDKNITEGIKGLFKPKE
ncbi:MAG: DUF748 domain-containing protein [Planctomycetota bacterium]|jgi:uncharacterized protein involved in outer membrane biogenesis